MADKTINDLTEATQILQQDLFVLQQENTAKKLSGQTLITYLLRMIDGHGGIRKYEKISSVGLVDTYRFTFADESVLDIPVTNGKAITSVKQTSVTGLNRTYTITFNDGSSQEFAVTDGRSIQSVQKTGTSGLVDTYTIAFNDGSSQSFAVTNGAKGDKGDNTYTHIKFASQEPTASSHSMGDVPDKWIGFYWGNSSTAPTDWTLYKWYQFKGDKGDTGNPATLASSSVEYKVSDSGTIIPSGAWQTSVPVVAQGKYLWTRTTNNFNTGNPVVSYSVSRMGLDGSGSVSSVANISPDANGNVPLTAEHVGALSNTGGDLAGELRMNGQPISGLNAPTANDQAANMGFVNQQVKQAAPRNLLDNSDFRNPVNQREFSDGTIGDHKYCIDRWLNYSSSGDTLSVSLSNGGITIAQNLRAELIQFIPNFSKYKEKTLTVAIGLADGTFYCNSGTVPEKAWEGFASIEEEYFRAMLHTYDGENGAVFILAKKNVTVAWIALYEGNYTIDTLPEYRSKGYGVELAECQRYYKRIRNAKFVISPNSQTLYRGSSIYFGDMARPDNLTVNALPDGDGNIGLVQKVSFVPLGTTDLQWDGAISNTISIATSNEAWAGRQVILYCIELSADIL